MTPTAATPAQHVYIVDDDAAVRDSLHFLLDSVGLNATTFADATTFLDQYSGGAGILVLDVRMPNMSGLELQEELIKRQYTGLKIIFISGHGDIEMAVEALKRGACDFLTKPFRDQELLDRIHKAMDDNQMLLEKSAQSRDVAERVTLLTSREQDVMSMVADGKANKVVAMDLGISQRTVEIHRSNVMSKMGVTSVAQLIRRLHRVGYFND